MQRPRQAGRTRLAQRVGVPVLPTELLELMSVLEPVGEPVAEPEAPIDVPLPVELVSVLPVPDAVVEPVVDGGVVDDVSALVVGAGAGVGVVVVVEVVDVSVDVSRWHADRDSAAINARAAQRASWV